MGDIVWSTGEQELLCAAHALSPSIVCADALLAIEGDFDRLRFPINGLRHRPEGGTCGWYIWSGTKFSRNADFFVPMHAHHLLECCPAVIKYLGLPPGWRFLFAPEHEDVWADPSLLVSA